LTLYIFGVLFFAGDVLPRIVEIVMCFVSRESFYRLSSEMERLWFIFHGGSLKWRDCVYTIEHLKWDKKYSYNSTSSISYSCHIFGAISIYFTLGSESNIL
jgi:hypothetical protein